MVQATGTTESIQVEEVGLERAGVRLHLSRMQAGDGTGAQHILLVHGVSNGSHVFDIDVGDYSLSRRLTREGFVVWSLDIAGYARSGAVQDGFMVDSAYAARDIDAAVNRICHMSDVDTVDVLGWSWGTVTCSRFVCAHPEHVGRLVLYAPIISGVGALEVTDPFSRNTWESATSDFQRTPAGEIDDDTIDPIVVGMWCSACWRHDRPVSPNGGRRDCCVDRSETLIDLAALSVPTLIVCGDRDPFLDYERIAGALNLLPTGSAVKVVEGGAHALIVERHGHLAFQQAIVDFLK